MRVGGTRGCQKHLSNQLTGRESSIGAPSTTQLWNRGGANTISAPWYLENSFKAHEILNMMPGFEKLAQKYWCIFWRLNVPSCPMCNSIVAKNSHHKRTAICFIFQSCVSNRLAWNTHQLLRILTQKIRKFCCILLHWFPDQILNS